MSNKNAAISNYQSYDYEKDFWTKERTYEHLSESKIIQSLIKKIKSPIHSIMDAGCGFGRLFPIYKEFADSYILLDYSEDMLESAKKRIQDQNVSYIQGNLYSTNIDNESADLIISIRTAHHLPKLDDFFKELHRICKLNGHIIIECPNKRHIKNILKYLLKRNSENPFNKNPLQLSDCFFNYHPKEFEKFIKKYFIIRHKMSSSFFRVNWIKKFIPGQILVWLEFPLKQLLSNLYLTPSQIYLCQKIEDVSIHGTGDKL